MSAVAMAKSMGIEIPWDSPTPSYGLHVDADDGQVRAESWRDDSGGIDHI